MLQSGPCTLLEEGEEEEETFISSFSHTLGQENKFRLKKKNKSPICFSAHIAGVSIPFQILCYCYTEIFDIFNIFPQVCKESEFYLFVCSLAASCSGPDPEGLSKEGVGRTEHPRFLS